MAMTINGFIAKENDKTPWSDATWASYSTIVRNFGNMIVGRRTFEIMQKANEFHKTGNPVTVIVSNSSLKVPDQFTVVYTPEEAFDILETKGFTKALLGGGSKLNAAYMERGLVDEIVLDIEPQIFGRGIPLFHEMKVERKLVLQESIRIGQDVLQLHYRVRNKT